MKPYTGNKPYIFVSYSHKEEDKEIVLATINELAKRGVRIFYDEGIETSEEWVEYIARRIKDSAGVLFFPSKNFAESKNCRREVNFAVDKDKPYFSVMLCKFEELTDGLQMQLGSINAINFNKDLSIEDFCHKLLNNGIMKNPLIIADEEEAKAQLDDFTVETKSLTPTITIAIGIVKYNGCVLMTKRKKAEGNLSWGFPASNIKPSEVDEMDYRIVREVQSETNVKTELIDLLGYRIQPTTNVIAYYYALSYVSGQPLNLDDHENLEATWVPLSEYKNLVTSHVFEKVVDYLDDNRPSISMAVVIKDNKILLAHRKESGEKLSYVFPGGSCEANESAIDTAIRELKEETNIDSTFECLIGRRIHPITRRDISYVALNPQNFNLKIGDDDLDDLLWVDIKELDKYIPNLYDKVVTYIKNKINS